jgi:hypothetical protein
MHGKCRQLCLREYQQVTRKCNQEPAMSIDSCPYDFDRLVNERMALRFGELKSAMVRPLNAAGLVGYKSATKEALQFLDKPADFPGCYVF